jgi:hypothetical protein
MSDSERSEPTQSPEPIEPVRKERRSVIPAEAALRLCTDRMGTESRNGYEPGWDVVLAPLEALAAE